MCNEGTFDFFAAATRSRLRIGKARNRCSAQSRCAGEAESFEAADERKQISNRCEEGTGSKAVQMPAKKKSPAQDARQQ
jgi:hypothetical protein